MTTQDTKEERVHIMNNDELATAILSTREMLRASSPDSPAYIPLGAHFKLLLEIQYKRACQPLVLT